MEFQKITNFLDTNSDNKDLPKFGTKEWIEVYDESKVIIKYIDIKDLVNNIKDNTIKTSMLRSYLCGFNDAYVKGNITVTEPFLNLFLNLLNIKQVSLEILIILIKKKLQIMMVMKLIILNMMQIKLVKMKLKLLFH